MKGQDVPATADIKDHAGLVGAPFGGVWFRPQLTFLKYGDALSIISLVPGLLWWRLPF